MNFKQEFFDITNLIQQEFDRNLDMYGEKIKCGRGCSECCSQIFSITLLDGYIIQEHIKTLPSEKQLLLKEKATNYIEKKNEELQIPCPALGIEGECTIYEARPVICRRFGMPIYDYKNPTRVHACHLNFKDGEEIADNELIPNQTAIGKKWDELKEQFNNHNAPIEPDGKTTISESIVSSFS